MLNGAGVRAVPAGWVPGQSGTRPSCALLFMDGGGGQGESATWWMEHESAVGFGFVLTVLHIPPLIKLFQSDERLLWDRNRCRVLRPQSLTHFLAMLLAAPLGAGPV